MDKQILQSNIKQVINRIIALVKPSKIILFGSAADDKMTDIRSDPKEVVENVVSGIYGMWKDNEKVANVDKYVRGLRRGKFEC